MNFLRVFKEYLSQNGNELFTSDVFSRLLTSLDVKLDRWNPQNIVSRYLKWIDIDFCQAELAKYWSPAKIFWNQTFHDFYDSRFQMIYRGKLEFFHDIHIDVFFNTNFFHLTQREKWLLYDLVKEWWEYYEKIKDFRQYPQILEEASIASKKMVS